MRLPAAMARSGAARRACSRPGAPWRPKPALRGPAAPATPRARSAAKRTLTEAGYKGERIVLLSGTDVPRINAICEVMADLCRKLGMNFDLVATDWGTVNQRILSPKPLDQGGWSMFGIFSGGLDHLSPANHLVIRGNGRAGVPSWQTDTALEELRSA